MTTRTTCLRQEPRASLANPGTMIVVAMITAMTFSASGAAPTPLYHLYQEHFGLTTALATIIFAPLVSVVLMTLSVIAVLLIWHMPETAQTKPGGLTSLRPHVSIPIRARQTLAQLTPV